MRSPWAVAGGEVSPPKARIKIVAARVIRRDGKKAAGKDRLRALALKTWQNEDIVFLGKRGEEKIFPENLDADN
jgi:hypothetical protein